jgi:tetratricopeptide (TPR) repeat protein
MHELIVANLMLGQPEEAQLVLDAVPEQARSQFFEEQIQVWIAMGDYARAGKSLERDIAAREKAIDPKFRPQQYGTVLDWLLTSAADSSRQLGRLGVLYGILAAWGNADKNYVEDQQRADRNASRGMLALEEGDLDTAMEYFRKANSYKVAYVGDKFVNVCLGAMEKQDAKAKKKP